MNINEERDDLATTPKTRLETERELKATDGHKITESERPGRCSRCCRFMRMKNKWKWTKRTSKEMFTRTGEKWRESAIFQFLIGEFIFILSYIDLFQDISFLLIAYYSESIFIHTIAMFSTLFSLGPKIFFYIWIYFSKLSHFTTNQTFLQENYRFIFIYELTGLSTFYEMAYPTINGPVIDFPLLVCLYKFITEDLIQGIIQIIFLSIYKDDDHIYVPVGFLIFSALCSVFFSVLAVIFTYHKASQDKKDKILFDLQTTSLGSLYLSYKGSTIYIYIYIYIYRCS